MALDHYDNSVFIAAGETADARFVAEQERAGIASGDSRPELESWPVLDDDALYGLAGDVVRTIGPHTEADPVAVLAHFLAYFGNAVGPTPHFAVGADLHCANLNGIIVGATAKGRKGTSEGQARRLFVDADPVWTKDRVVHGLSSGEGLIAEVADLTAEEIEKQSTPRDRRLLVIESEFASTLKTMKRDGNILSGVVRQAWDSGNLRVMTRKSPLRATGAHISIIGHVTTAELLRHVDSNDANNGFANRFLWICARRSKELPDGGSLTDADLRPVQEAVAKALDASRRIYEVRRDPAASELWRATYHDLSSERPGLFGAVTSRAEAQVVRLSLVYALLDSSNVIRIEHLRAALAFWNYAAASARYIFGERLGDPIADRVISALRDSPEGMSRSDISGLFDRHATAPEIERGLALLLQFRLATTEKIYGPGRPKEWWRAV